MDEGWSKSEPGDLCMYLYRSKPICYDWSFPNVFALISGVETVKLSDNQVNTMAFDNPAFCVTMPSSTVKFDISDKLVLVFHK